MSSLEMYMTLLNDSILGSLMFVPGSSYVGDVMVILGKYNPYIILLISLFGSLIAVSINWVIGRFVRKLNMFASREHVLSKAELFFNAKGKWLLLFSMIPLWGALFTTAAGVLRFSFFHFLILVTFSKFVGFSLAIFFYN
jgi:membrane protein YqaA with SNARE-associated domain